MKKADMVSEIALQAAQAWEELHQVEYQECPVCETFEEYNDFVRTNLFVGTALREWCTLDKLCKTLGIDYSEEKSNTQAMKYMDMTLDEKKLYVQKK